MKEGNARIGIVLQDKGQMINSLQGMGTAVDRHEKPGGINSAADNP